MIKTEKAIFAAGCFWHVEDAFRRIKGVISAVSGYTGGATDKPTYEEVCTDTTGHAEVVEVIFDPKKVSYEKLLALFWSIHNPTQVNRQGPDVGSQYRSAIFYTTATQKKVAEASLKSEQEKYGQPIATKIMKAQKFWRAEDYHQNYLGKHGAFVCGV